MVEGTGYKVINGDIYAHILLSVLAPPPIYKND